MSNNALGTTTPFVSTSARRDPSLGRDGLGSTLPMFERDRARRSREADVGFRRAREVVSAFMRSAHECCVLARLSQRARRA